MTDAPAPKYNPPPSLSAEFEFISMWILYVWNLWCKSCTNEIILLFWGGGSLYHVTPVVISCVQVQTTGAKKWRLPPTVSETQAVRRGVHEEFLIYSCLLCGCQTEPLPCWPVRRWLGSRLAPLPPFGFRCDSTQKFKVEKRVTNGSKATAHKQNYWSP